jgi:hypothetical protein
MEEGRKWNWKEEKWGAREKAERKVGMSEA